MINQFFKPKTGSKKSQPEEEDEHRMEEESSTKKKALKSTDDKFMGVLGSRAEQERTITDGTKLHGLRSFLEYGEFA